MEISDVALIAVPNSVGTARVVVVVDTDQGRCGRH
jgi:hypothetical protein